MKDTQSVTLRKPGRRRNHATDIDNAPTIPPGAMRNAILFAFQDLVTVLDVLHDLTREESANALTHQEAIQLCGMARGFRTVIISGNFDLDNKVTDDETSQAVARVRRMVAKPFLKELERMAAEGYGQVGTTFQKPRKPR